VLRVSFGRDEPGNLRKVPGGYILLEDVEERAAFKDIGAGACLLR